MKRDLRDWMMSMVRWFYGFIKIMLILLCANLPDLKSSKAIVAGSQLWLGLKVSSNPSSWRSTVLTETLWWLAMVLIDSLSLSSCTIWYLTLFAIRQANLIPWTRVTRVGQSVDGGQRYCCFLIFSTVGFPPIERILIVTGFYENHFDASAGRKADSALDKTELNG